MAKEVISLDILTERPVVRNDEVSEQDIVIQISSKQENVGKQGEQKFLNLCIVVDRSGSMEGEKLETAKKSCIDIFNRLRADDLFTVVFFDDKPQVIVNPQTRRSEIVGRIEKVGSGGQTNLSNGWYLGLQELQSYKTESYINRLILLSDGQANKGITKKNVLGIESAKFRDLGITTSTIGIGNDFVEDILEVLASESGGRFWYIQDSNIEDIINEEFKGSLSVIAERPRVELSIPKGLKVSKQLNDLRIVSGKYRIRPITSDYIFNFALRLEFDPSIIDASGPLFKVALYDGDDLISEAEKVFLLRPLQEYVTSEENPLVRSVVQQYEISTTDEIMLEKLKEGDISDMEEMMEDERNRMDQAQRMLHDKMETGQQVTEFLRELQHMDRKMLENQNMIVIIQLLQWVQNRPIKGIAGLQVDNLLMRLRKTLMYRMHGEKGRRYEHYHDRDVHEDLLNDALGLANDLVKMFPDQSDLIEIKGKIDEQLARY